MFRLFLRDAVVATVLTALVAGAAVVLGLPAVARPPAAPWALELARYGPDPLLAPRDAALVAFGLAALAALLRAVFSALRLLRRDYPALAHLAEALAGALARRIGALAGVLLAVAQGTASARTVTAPDMSAATASATSLAPAAGMLDRGSPAPQEPSEPPRRVPPHAPAAPARSQRGQVLGRLRRPPAPRLLRRVGLALRYTVQPEDTMDDVAARFGFADWQPILRATRGLPQPVAGPITDPDRIFPGQILLIPLPCPALRLAGDHVLYVVQTGDYLSAIAARFLGDWRAYRAIADLNRGVHQPDGRALEEANLIQPGWVLRLPRAYVVARPDGTAVTHRLVVDVRRPVRPRHELRTRRPFRHVQHAGGRPAGRAAQRGAPHPLHSRLHLREARPRIPRGVRLRAIGAAHRRPNAPQPPGRHQVAPRRGPTVSCLPAAGARRKVAPRRTRPAQRHRSTAQGPARPRRRIFVRPGHPIQITGDGHHRQVWRRTAPPPTAGPRPTPLVASPRSARPGHGTPPPALEPDMRPWWPLPLLLVFVPLLAVVARKRRRTAGGTGSTAGSTGNTGSTGSSGSAGTPPAAAGGHLAPSMRRAIAAAQGGVPGRLAAAVDAADPRLRTGDTVRPLLAALDAAGAAAGLSPQLALATRTVTVADGRASVVIEGQRFPDHALGAVTAALGQALGRPVRGSQVTGPDGAPCLSLTLAHPRDTPLSVPDPAHAPIGADAASPHPAPLVIPLGRTLDGADLSINLGRLSPLLIAGGAHGASTLLATLLASVLAQATPAQLRLLVASTDDELRHMVPALEHLEAPPADAGDVTAAARIVAQAHRVVLDRFTAGEAAPEGPAYLIVLDAVEELRADPHALDRLEAVCRNGRVCDVHVVATTGDPAALAEVGLLDAFATRLARPLAERESVVLCGDDRAARLAAGEMLLQEGGAAEAIRLAPFILTLPDVRDVIAHVACALAPEVETAALTPEAETTAGPLTSGEHAEPMALDEPAEHAVQNGPTPDVPADSVVRGEDTRPEVAAPERPHTESAAPDTASPASDEVADAGTGPAETVVRNEEREPDAAPTIPAAPAATAAAPAPATPVAGSEDAAGRAPGRPVMPEKSGRAMADAPIEVRVFGDIAVLAQGRPVVLKPREQRLLAALAIMGPHAVHPERLVEALFPDDDPLTGQDKLEHAITAIRLVLKKAGVPVKRAGVVRRSIGGYVLDPTLVRVDAYGFRDLLRRAETTESEERFALLAQAVDLYRGDLCGDLALDWVEGYRYAWRKEYLSALYELALHYDGEAKDPLGALRVARRLAAEEPLQDHYHQMVLELLAARGDLAALDRYEKEMRAVYAQHDSEIDDYTAALCERLRAQVLRERESSDSQTTRAG